MKAMKYAALLTALALLLHAGKAESGGKAPKRFYYDLGPETIDISAYPDREQGNFAVFVRSCSQCHTLARPLNAPLVTRKQWSPYVGRMHAKAKAARGQSFSPDEAKLILDFLVYDSKVRKIEHKADFDALTAKLKKQFAEAGSKR